MKEIDKAACRGAVQHILEHGGRIEWDEGDPTLWIPAAVWKKWQGRIDPDQVKVYLASEFMRINPSTHKANLSYELKGQTIEVPEFYFVKGLAQATDLEGLGISRGVIFTEHEREEMRKLAEIPGKEELKKALLTKHIWAGIVQLEPKGGKKSR